MTLTSLPVTGIFIAECNCERDNRYPGRALVVPAIDHTAFDKYPRRGLGRGTARAAPALGHMAASF
jgi:hypothetical protein